MWWHPVSLGACVMYCCVPTPARMGTQCGGGGGVAVARCSVAAVSHGATGGHVPGQRPGMDTKVTLHTARCPGPCVTCNM